VGGSESRPKTFLRACPYAIRGNGSEISEKKVGRRGSIGHQSSEKKKEGKKVRLGIKSATLALRRWEQGRKDKVPDSQNTRCERKVFGGLENFEGPSI